MEVIPYEKLLNNLVLNILGEISRGNENTEKKWFRRAKTPTAKLHLIKSFSLCRSSRSEVFLRKGVLKICSKFTAEHPCRSAISIFQYFFIEIDLRHGCFPVNLLHIFRTPFPKNISGWLLLVMEKS